MFVAYQFNITDMQNNKTICFFFELHQPYRVNMPIKPELAKLNDFFVGPGGDNPNFIYGNKDLFEKVAVNSYISATKVWLHLLRIHPTLKISLSISGTLLLQCLEYEKYGKKVITNLQKLISTGQVEILAETFHHSLSFLYSTDEFLRQIKLHQDLIYRLFGVIPTSFRNTEMIYNNKIGEIMAQMGYLSTVIEDKESSLEYESPLKIGVHKPIDLDETDQKFIETHSTLEPNQNLCLIIKNYSIVWHFFMLKQHTPEHLFELTERENKQLIGIFCDFEIFGEHNHHSHNTFKILENYINLLITHSYQFVTPSLTPTLKQKQVIDIPEYISWTNSWHDLSSWRGNLFQEKAFEKLLELHALAQNLYDNPDPHAQELLEAYRKLTTSDHFYYMSDLPGADGEMHAIFNAYPSPKAAFETYVQVVDEVKKRMIKHLDKSQKV